MHLDSEEQRKLLQGIIDGTSFTASGAQLTQIAQEVQQLRLSINNATIEDQPALELASE